LADLHFTNLLIVVAAAFVVPLLLAMVPSLRLPASASRSSTTPFADWPIRPRRSGCVVPSSS
jgi:hypothetical protein